MMEGFFSLIFKGQDDYSCPSKIPKSLQSEGIRSLLRPSTSQPALWELYNLLEKDTKKMKENVKGVPQATHHSFPLSSMYPLSGVPPHRPHCALQPLSSALCMLLAPCVTPHMSVFPPETRSWHTVAHTCKARPMPGPEPTWARTGSARGPLVLSKQVRRGNAHKWSNYK